MNTDPEVSVVIAVFNCEGLIIRCVESLVAQTLPPAEIIAIDDGSTDGTLAELYRLQDRFPGLLTVRSQPNAGPGPAWNLGISLCSSRYIAMADADDEFPSGRLRGSAELIRATGADLVGGQVVGRLGRRLRLAKSRFPTAPTEIAARVSRGFDPFPQATMMMTRDAFSRYGGYRSIRRAQDLELMLRWAHRGAHLAVSPEVWATYRFRPEFFSLDVQTRWMVGTQYARDIATLDDDAAIDFDQWFSSRSLRPARREARRRVLRLAARLAVGSLDRRS